MVKKIYLIVAFILSFCFVSSGCVGQAGENEKAGAPAVSTVSADSGSRYTESGIKGYKDGVYEGKSALTSEGYYGKAKITVEKGKIKTVEFQIYDTTVFKTYGNSKHKDAEELLLDETYGAEVYKDAPLYQQQTENELKGIEEYKLGLVKEQEVDKVDAISGATWSYNIFKEVMKTTLAQAVGQ